jgi:hypothetical protein
MRPIHHDREQHQKNEHTGPKNEHTGIKGSGMDAFSANNGWLSDEHSNAPQSVRGGTIDSTAEGLNASPTSAGPPVASEPSALVTVIGGDAYATGTNTVVTGAVSNDVKDLGYATVASGVAEFEASGTSSHGEPAAGADTFLSVAGADMVMKVELDLNFHIGNQDVAVSKLAYYAIDIDNWAPPNGPIVVDFQAHAISQFGEPHGYLPSHVAPSGNLATVTASADAQGLNSLASTLTQSLAVENHFSLVSGAAMVAA